MSESNEDATESMRSRLRESFRDRRTPEQIAHSEGYTAGYKAAQERYENRAEYLEMLKVSGEPEFIEILRRSHENGGVLTTEEACRVWEEMHLIVEGHPEGRIVLLLNNSLARELAKGLRCGVCGAYQSPDCTEGC